MSNDGSFSVEVKVFRNALETMGDNCKKMSDTLELLQNHRQILIDYWEGEDKDSVIDKLNSLLYDLNEERDTLVNCTNRLTNILNDIIRKDKELANK